MEQFLLTKEKLEDLKAELHTLKTERRREIARSLEHAKSLGDLSENAEYHEARTEQAEVEDRIRRIEAMLKGAKVVSKTKGDEAQIGSTVVVRKGRSTSDIEYTLVGAEEADMMARKISHASPLGQALIGKKKGDSFTFTTPGGDVKYTVVKVK